MGFADRLLITRVLAEPEGDAFFPEINETIWKLAEERVIETDSRDSSELRLQIYRRR